MADAQSILLASVANDVLILTVTIPTIDADHAIDLKVQFARALESAPANVRAVRLEVSEVLAMSSRGFETLLHLHTSCRDRGIPLTLSKLTPIFHRLLERMGFLRLFTVDA